MHRLPLSAPHSTRTSNKGYTRRSSRDVFSGRGFNSHRLHHPLAAHSLLAETVGTWSSEGRPGPSLLGSNSVPTDQHTAQDLGLRVHHTLAQHSLVFSQRGRALRSRSGALSPNRPLKCHAPSGGSSRTRHQSLGLRAGSHRRLAQTSEVSARTIASPTDREARSIG